MRESSRCSRSDRRRARRRSPRPRSGDATVTEVRALLVADAIEKKFVRAAGRPVLSFVPGSRTGGAFNPNEGVSVAFDPKTLSPEAQALYRKIGKRFDSGRTLSQAEKTRNGANKIIGLHAE